MHPSEHAKNTPDKPAYVMSPSGTVVTYAELNERSLRGARVLRRWRVNPPKNSIKASSGSFTPARQRCSWCNSVKQP